MDQHQGWKEMNRFRGTIMRFHAHSNSDSCGNTNIPMWSATRDFFLPRNILLNERQDILTSKIHGHAMIPKSQYLENFNWTQPMLLLRLSPHRILLQILGVSLNHVVDRKLLWLFFSQRHFLAWKTRPDRLLLFFCLWDSLLHFLWFFKKFIELYVITIITCTRLTWMRLDPKDFLFGICKRIPIPGHFLKTWQKN